jgi:hypothetical protein
MAMRPCVDDSDASGCGAGGRAFGLEARSLRSLGGNSGTTWGIGDRVLRIGRRAVADAELAASAAAAEVVPVPQLIGRLEADETSAVLLEMLPGQTAAEVARREPGRALAAGRAANLNEPEPPRGFRPLEGIRPCPEPTRRVYSGGRTVHTGSGRGSRTPVR